MTQVRDSYLCRVCGDRMVLLDEEADTWYCYKDDELFYATENKWADPKFIRRLTETPSERSPSHPSEPSDARFIRPSDAHPESSIDRQWKPREEGVTGFVWTIALGVGFFILLLIGFYLIMAICFYPKPGSC